jgi:hypothetical protein
LILFTAGVDDLWWGFTIADGQDGGAHEKKAGQWFLSALLQPKKVEKKNIAFFVNSSPVRLQYPLNSIKVRFLFRLATTLVFCTRAPTSDLVRPDRSPSPLLRQNKLRVC